MVTSEEVEDSAWNVIYPGGGREDWSAASLHVLHPKDDKGLSLLSTEGFLSSGTVTKNYQCEKPVWVYCLSGW